MARLKPGYESDVEEIEAEINCKIEKIGWLPGFYSLPPDVQIAGSHAYKTGKVRNFSISFGNQIFIFSNFQFRAYSSSY